MAFRTQYYGSMDRQDTPYASEIDEAGLEEPIAPINQLGETVPEALGQRNIIQTTQAAIRGGAGTLQMVLRPPPDSIGPTSVGARIGKEVREALREVARANEVKIASAELPTSNRGMSGFDVQRETFSEETRLRNLDAVRDSIKFVGDVNGGGGVDILSWEFSRSVNDADWNKEHNFERKTEGEERAILVDARTGRTTPISKEESIHVPVDENFEYAADMRPRKLDWDDLNNWASKNRQWNEAHRKTPRDEDFRPVTPEEVWAKAKFDEQIDNLLGSAANSERIANAERRELQAVEQQIEAARAAENQEVIDQLEREKTRLRESVESLTRSARSNRQQIEEIKERRKSFVPINRYGLKQTAQTFGEAGIWAMKETEEGMARGTVKNPLYVGPEIGWPDWYGGHPEEFKKVVQEARNEMVNMITKPKITDAQGKEIESPFYDPRIDHRQAEQMAKQHIKGLLDTSHLGMWFKHFKPEVDPSTGKLETEERRLQRFNNWFKDQVEDLAKSGVVGGIQLVDSGSGEHGHLPPGEGIFPIIETAKIFKKHGFSGFMVSEGHEEERFGAGRIRSKLWQRAAGRIPDHGYFAGAGPAFPQQTQGYFGRTYSPLFMFGSYAPSNEFKLWSEVPLE